MSWCASMRVFVASERELRRMSGGWKKKYYAEAEEEWPGNSLESLLFSSFFSLKFRKIWAERSQRVTSKGGYDDQPGRLNNVFKKFIYTYMCESPENLCGKIIKKILIDGLAKSIQTEILNLSQSVVC